MKQICSLLYLEPYFDNIKGLSDQTLQDLRPKRCMFRTIKNKSLSYAKGESACMRDNILVIHGGLYNG
jgi:hypothetical protein